MARARKALVVVIVCAFALRWLAWIYARDLECFGDECTYFRFARDLAERGVFSRKLRWPPGYVAFLGAHFELGLGAAGARFTQVLLSTALVPMVYWLGRRAAACWSGGVGHRVGIVAAAIVAFHPTLIAFSHYLWTETLFLFVLVAALVQVVRARDAGSVRSAVGAGLLLGLASLVRALALYLTPLIGLWLSLDGRGRRFRWRVGLALCAAAVALVAPWTVRNAIVHSRLIVLDMTLGVNLVKGNSQYGPISHDWHREGMPMGFPHLLGCGQKDKPSRMDCLKRKGFQMILDDPVRFVRNLPIKFADLVNPTSFLVRRIRTGGYGEWPAPWSHGLVAWTALYSAVLMLLGTIGWIYGPPSPVRSATGIAATYIVLVSLVLFGMSRFRLPLEPLWAVGAALLLQSEVRRASWRSRWRLVTIGIGIALAGFWSARVGDLFTT